jgi:uncharacterized protein YkwD
MILILTALLLVAPAEDSKLSKTETQMIESINEFRAKYKLPPLTMDPTLMKVARYRAPYFTHNYQGRWNWDECKRYGFDGRTTDNLAQGNESAEDAVHGWATSPVGHARQMLGQFKMNGQWVDYHFDKVGVARCGRNWIAIFGKSDKTAVTTAKPVTD